MLAVARAPRRGRQRARRAPGDAREGPPGRATHAERDAAQDRYERYRAAVTSATSSTELERTHPSPTPLPCSSRRSSACAPWTTKIADARGDARGRGRGQLRGRRPRPSGGRCRAGRSPCRRSASASRPLGLRPQLRRLWTSAPGPLLGGASSRSSALALAGGRLVAAPGRPPPAPAARTSRSTAGCAAGRTSSRSSGPSRATATRSSTGSASSRTPRPRSAWRRGGPRRRDRAAARPPRRPDRRGAPRAAARQARHGGARDRAEDRGARRPRPDREGAAGPRAPRGRGRDAERPLERARDDEADARARVEQNPVDAEEVAALSERLAGWREELEVLRRRERVYARTLREINTRRAGDDAARHALPRAAHGRRHRADHRRPLPARAGRRHGPRHRRVLARARRLGPGHRRCPRARWTSSTSPPGSASSGS